MTTVAYDGKVMAADTLCVDGWGLVDYTEAKIQQGEDFLVGFAGELAPCLKWWDKVSGLMSCMEILKYGYPNYSLDNNQSIMLVFRDEVYIHSSGAFIKVSRPYHAIGSGRDYALAALHLRESAVSAVNVAATFDNGTNDIIISKELKYEQVSD